MPKKLRFGYTTGACTAAAAKAAALGLFSGMGPKEVEIPFPDGKRVLFSVHEWKSISKKTAQASVIKDAGDDPDVTNGSEIVARVQIDHNKKENNENETFVILGGEGVGVVTKPGLPVKVGEPAINPVPRMMIRAAVSEALPRGLDGRVIVTISVVNGKELAKKTLNKRLGIVGGLSILGTTGIVRPISAEAWTATIKASMDVALASGLKEIVISTGRTSERAVQEKLKFPEEALVMMGDYLLFSLEEAARHRFQRIHLACMWAKLCKASMEIPQTHVKHGIIEVKGALKHLQKLGAEETLINELTNSNTIKEIYERLAERNRKDIIKKVCLKAKEYAEKVSGLQVNIYLVQSSGGVVMHV